MARPTLDSALRLDVRKVLRWLENDRTSLGYTHVRWSHGAEIAVTHEGARLVLDYQADGVPVREALRLDRTPCHYGGARTWVHCPKCDARRAVLYLAGASGGRFLCRGCYGWPYGSQRERAPERARRRAGAIRVRQGDEQNDPCAPLRRPPYQRLATYERRTAEYEAAMHAYLAGITADVERTRARLAGVRQSSTQTIDLSTTS